jgi:hypothetical protein
VLRCHCHARAFHATDCLAQEIHAWARLGSHPNVVRYYSSWFEHGSHDGEHAFIQLEKCGPPSPVPLSARQHHDARAGRIGTECELP